MCWIGRRGELTLPRNMSRNSCWPLWLVGAFPLAAHSQAWLPDKGAFSAAVLYSDVYDTKHYLPDGDEITWAT